jgi:hypothetical protein
LSIWIDRDELPIWLVEELEPFIDVRRDQVVFWRVESNLKSGPVVVAEVRRTWDEPFLPAKVQQPFLVIRLESKPIYQRQVNDSSPRVPRTHIVNLNPLFSFYIYRKSIQPETSWFFEFMVRM